MNWRDFWKACTLRRKVARLRWHRGLPPHVETKPFPPEKLEGFDPFSGVAQAIAAARARDEST